MAVDFEECRVCGELDCGTVEICRNRRKGFVDLVGSSLGFGGVEGEGDCVARHNDIPYGRRRDTGGERADLGDGKARGAARGAGRGIGLGFTTMSYIECAVLI